MTAATDWDRLLSPLLSARRFDETLLRSAGLVTGVFHVSIGMEATAAGLACVKAEGDIVMLGHRNHAHLVAIGSDPEALYREVLGRAGGAQQGRAGSMHLADASRGVPYTSAMLGGGAAVANGIALALARGGTGRLAFAFFGDGAMGEGIVYETFGLARAWHLPIVFVCESNAPAVERGRFAQLARAHGVAAVSVDGSSPRAAVRALSYAAAFARDGSGPHFVEATTAAWPGNATFIPKLERAFDVGRVANPPGDEFEAADPVRREAQALLSDGVPLDRLRALDAAISERMRRAFESAALAPPATGGVAHQDVWG
ncbi:MAG TPA: thiamine pyrophosphate-dependent enzyme [Solirubrobacteraceae bacterium]|nr:thiamine pyrophosphate-dependent enzyme [Solirubrobacteraceae bacterium]